MEEAMTDHQQIRALVAAVIFSGAEDWTDASMDAAINAADRLLDRLAGR